MSLQKLYNEAKKQDKTIKIKDVKEWYERILKTRYYGGKTHLLHHMHIMNIR